MGSELLDIFLLSLLAMFNPALLAAVTVLLLLPSPKRLMVGYLLGAYTTSITLGLLIVSRCRARARRAPPSTRLAHWRTSSSACSRWRSRGFFERGAISRFRSADG